MRIQDLYLGWHKPSSQDVLAWVRETRDASISIRGQAGVVDGTTNKASRHGLQIGR